MSTEADHPIVALATTLLVPDGASFVLDAAGRARLEAALTGLGGRPDLVPAVRALLLFAAFVDIELHARAASDAILDTIQTVRPAMEAAGFQLKDVVAAVTRQDRTLHGRTQRHSFVRVDALIGLLAKEALDGFLNTRNAC